jgi:hypothetical protein
MKRHHSASRRKTVDGAFSWHQISSRHGQPRELAARHQRFEVSIETDQMLALVDDGGG